MNHPKQQHLKFTNLPPIPQLIRETTACITLPETSGWGETNVQNKKSCYSFCPPNIPSI